MEQIEQRLHRVAHRFPARTHVARSAKIDGVVSVSGQGGGRDRTSRHGRLEQLAVPVLVSRAYESGGTVSGNRGADRLPDELERLPVAARGKRIPTPPATFPAVGVPATGADPLDQFMRTDIENARPAGSGRNGLWRKDITRFNAPLIHALHALHARYHPHGRRSREGRRIAQSARGSAVPAFRDGRTGG